MVSTNRHKIMITILASIFVASVLWFAAETHYRACVEGAIGRTAGSDVFAAEDFDVLEDLPRTIAVRGCSRWPL